jgi:hypothetical protein
VNEVRKENLAVKTNCGNNLRAENFIALPEITNSVVVCDVVKTLSTV